MARGGKREGAGRPPGALSKATKDIKEAAQQYSAEALKVLVTVARNGDSEAARVTAASAILDRAHGKPGQHVDMDHGLTDSLAKLLNRIDGKSRSIPD